MSGRIGACGDGGNSERGDATHISLLMWGGGGISCDEQPSIRIGCSSHRRPRSPIYAADLCSDSARPSVSQPFSISCLALLLGSR